MSDDDTFTQFVARIRSGDEQAASDLVKRYEPLIRREVRMQLEDQQLNRAFDSMDVCQSVLASFFLRTAAGEYDLERPEQLVGLLVTMARNKLASAARREYRVRRDARRVSEAAAEGLDRVPDAEDSPGEVLATKELLEQFRQSLSDQERQIVELRGDGLTWADVAARLGGTAQSRRMQLSRAVERVVRELGIEPADV
ncbi:MAG TPA: sigma-70 family RNA polymerase sigma factor [Fimbriiglobus sp.]|jgi:RNA polymerase sigma-70 factor (ECF subfamily)|nr:sigma-70 family RNA polymerase sigma factor [Fimbriiglobus sp.]